MLVLAGVAVAWLAQVAWTARGYGFLADMGFAFLGSAVAGMLVWAMISADVGMVLMFVVGGVGAALAIVAQRGFWRSAPVRA